MKSMRKKTKTISNESNISLEKAILLHRNGDLKGASLLYRNLLKQNPKDFEAHHLLGVIELQNRNWRDAAEHIEKSLQLNPNQLGALNNYGIVLKELKLADQAIVQYQKAIVLKNDDHNTYMNLGNAYQALYQLELAIDAYNKCIVLEPSNSAVLMNRGFALGALGQHQSAISSYKLALHIDPNDANVYNNLGNSLRAISNLDLAVDCFLRAVELDPKFSDAFFNLGNVLRDQNRLEEALIAFNKSVELNPYAAEHYNNQGNTLLDLEQSSSAIKSFNEAIKLRPSYSQAYNNLGNAYLQLKDYQSSLNSYNLAVALNPGYAQAYNNRANLLRLFVLGNLAEVNYVRAAILDPKYPDPHNNLGVLYLENSKLKAALNCFNEAIKLNPKFADALYNKSNALRVLKLFEQSIAGYQDTLRLAPDYEYVKGLLVHAKMQICDWSGLETLLSELVLGIESNERVTPAFPVLALSDSVLLQRKAASIWASHKFPSSSVCGDLVVSDLGNPSRKLRIGYFSADFRDHPVSYLMADLFEHHNRNEFEIIAFSIGPVREDAMRKRLEKSFDVWIECDDLSDIEVAERARDLQLDIAVDLGGFTKNSRTGIFSLRCAPTQVSYIGYLGTMAAPYIDYLIADKVIIPDQYKSLYTEKIAYLPVYQANDSKRQMSDEQINRTDLGLPESAFVFGCFNTNYKITPQVFEVWMKILARVASSVLYIYADTEPVKQNLRREAQNRNIDPNRIFFAERVDQPKYLSRFKCVDLFLDTFPYNAGTTASDALWSGLAVLTLSGEAFASRMAASLLTALGMTELITSSLEEYEEMAVMLGTNSDQMNSVKTKLSIQKEVTDLFNTSKFTVNLEQVYKEMVSRVKAQEPPSEIVLNTRK